MDQRNEFISAWLKREEPMAELCRQFGIARKTGYKWLERFEHGGRAELDERSRAPRSSPQAIVSGVAAKVVAARERFPTWGARKLRVWLERQDGSVQWPAASSIGDLLKREGLIAARRTRRKTPPSTAPLSHAAAPNDVWCVDFKGWFRCGDGTRCDPLTMTDAHSRYLLSCRAVDKTDGPHVRGVMEAAFRAYGLPSAIRSDNGSPFASRAPGGLTRLSMWWLQLGIPHERIEPGRPDQNGRHERMHRTLKQETANPPAATRSRQQQAFAAFAAMYNQQRPHEALGGRTPAEVYISSARSFPARLPELEYPAGAHLRIVSQQGSVKWKCDRTFLSAVLARKTVGLLETADEFFDVYYGPLLIGWLDGRTQQFAPDRPQPRRRKRAEDA